MIREVASYWTGHSAIFVLSTTATLCCVNGSVMQSCPITKNWKERSMQISPVHIAVLFVNAGLLQPVPEASIALSVPSLCDGSSRQNGCGERERKCRHFRPNFRCGSTTFLHDFWGWGMFASEPSKSRLSCRHGHPSLTAEVGCPYYFERRYFIGRKTIPKRTDQRNHRQYWARHQRHVQ